MQYDLITGNQLPVTKKPRLDSEVVLSSTPPKDIPEMKSDGILCPICRENAANPCISSCNHIACYTCWQRLLKLKLECPICRSKVRVKHLKRIPLM